MSAKSADELEAELGTSEFDINPQETLRGLREVDPVHWSDSIGGWVVTRYDDVVTTFKDTAHFSNEGRQAKATGYLPDETRAQFKPLEDHYRTKGILNSDAPDHTRLRALVLAAFNPRVVEAMRPRIRSIVNDIFDQAVDRGGMEVITDLAWALPSAVLADILGAPPEARLLFKKWADDIIGFQGVNKPSVEVLQTAQRSLLAAREYLGMMIEERRREPTDDLMSHLVNAQADGQSLTQAELLSTCVTLMGAGQETTKAMVGNGIFLLLSHPEAWASLKEDPELIPSAVEEIVRYESPIPRQPRLMKRDVELGGKELRSGQVVFQMINAANRDPQHFSDPDVFDIRRKPNRHIGFGLGAHFCVGAPLARSEGKIVLETIIERFPAMSLVNPSPQWNPKQRASRALVKLDVRF